MIPYTDEELNAPDAESCPVLVAAGMLELNQTDPDAAMAMFLAHLALPNRTCCDSDGFAFERKQPTAETSAKRSAKEIA